MRNVYSLAEAAEMLGVTVDAMRKAALRGRLSVEYVGYMRVVTIDEIERYRRENLGRVGQPRKPQPPNSN